MKQILVICITFGVISNCGVLCSNKLADFLVDVLRENYTAASTDIGDIFTRDKLTKIGRSNFSEIVQMFGHKCEEHDVVTEDEYILKLWRIPGNLTKSVLLVHGNTESAYGFIHRGNTSMSITLANKGYDVWAINLRGTTESKRHKHLDPIRDANKFFNYSFYEWGLYDMPATIDYILNETGQPDLTVVSHSQGCADMFVMGSERPEYNKKVKFSLLLAPAANFHYLRGSTQFITESIIVSNNGTYTTEESGKETFSHDQIAPKYQAYCLNSQNLKSCVDGIFAFTGRDTRSFEPEFLYTYLGHYPAGTSTKVLHHIFQIIVRNKFSKYDYGKERNLAVYHSEEPPDIDLSKVTMKSGIITSKNDYYLSVHDADWIRNSLPNVVDFVVLPYEDFTHIDYIDGRYMNENFYPFFLEMLDKFS